MINRQLRGILWMLAGVFFMVCLDALVKWLSARYSVYQVLFIRNSVAMGVVFILLAFRNQFGQLKTSRKGWHFVRSVLAFLLNFGFFYALANQPLANVLAITFIAPSLVALLSILFLGERVDAWRWLAILVGLAGVWVILRPGSEAFNPAALVVFVSTFLYAVVAVSSRLLSETENSISLTFYMLPVSIVASGVMAPQVWVGPDIFDWTLLVCCGLFGLAGFWAITQAFRYAPASVVSPFEYTSMIWAILLGYFLWSEVPDNYTLYGAGMVVLSSFLMTARERRAESKQLREVRLKTTLEESS